MDTRSQQFEKDILRDYPDRDYNKQPHPGDGDNKFELLTNPGHKRPLVSFNGNIMGMNDEVDPNIFKTGGKYKRKTRSKRQRRRNNRKTKAGGRPKGKGLTWKDQTTFPEKFSNQASKMMEEGNAKRFLSITQGPTPGGPALPWDIENQHPQYSLPKSSLKNKKKGGKRKTHSKLRKKRKTRKIKSGSNGDDEFNRKLKEIDDNRSSLKNQLHLIKECLNQDTCKNIEDATKMREDAENKLKELDNKLEELHKEYNMIN